jgi:predicted metal-dependent RNase
LNNFFASFFLYKYGKQDFETPHLSASETLDTVIMSAAALILFIGVLTLFYKFRYRGESGTA